MAWFNISLILLSYPALHSDIGVITLNFNNIVDSNTSFTFAWINAKIGDFRNNMYVAVTQSQNFLNVTHFGTLEF